jgi:serine/threonine protein kinase
VIFNTLSGILHGDISLPNIIKYATSSDEQQNPWSIMSLQMSITFSDENFLGGITEQGYPQFRTESLPPEMFTKLTPSQLKTYKTYWATVEEEYNLDVDKSVLEPVIDLNSGSSYVVKCHFIPFTKCTVLPKKNNVTVPPLPYDLNPVVKSADLWALGQMVFLICTGKMLFPGDTRNGRLLDYATLCNWNPEPVIYEYVTDPLAQDVLLILLSRKYERENINMERILTHPFFVGKRASSKSLVKQITENRRIECAVHKREQLRKHNEAFEKEWLDLRTIHITCWDFEVLEKIHFSPSEIIRRTSHKNKGFPLPSNFILLPYRLSPLQPLCATDRLLAERTGELLLQLSKACFFTSIMKQATSHQDETVSQKWSSSEMLRVLDLSSEAFIDIQNEMADLAAKHVEAFRNDPMSVALKLVQKRILSFFSCFDNRPVYLYLVDEFFCQPVLSDEMPMEIPEEWRESIIQNGLLSTHLCSLHVRGVSRGMEGLAKLFYNDADQMIPPTWTEAARSLNNHLDEVSFVKELQLLQDALSDLYSTRHHLGGDDMQVIHDFISEIDPTLEFSGVRRVVAGDAWLWTTSDGAKTLEEMAHSLTFGEALKRSRRIDAALKEYKHRVENFEDDC